KEYYQENSHNSSPYRRPEKPQVVTESTSTSTKDLEATAIGNQPNTQNIETEAVEHNTDTETINQEETVKTESSEPKKTETQQKEEISREAVKEEIAEKEYTIEDLQNNPLAMTAFLLDLHAQDIQQQTEKTKRN